MNGHTMTDPEEITIPMPWGCISGKWWGPTNKQPIVALHGWQDNAGTFDTLAVLLSSNISVLCIDIPGHGFSSHLPDGQYYYLFWDGILMLRRIIKHYKWDKVSEQSKRWGPKQLQPIVALHGRQDNAGSFDKLIPLLPSDVSVLCLDMPGHGLSSHYSKSQFYYVFWDGILFLRRIVKYFKWSKVSIMGHSLGGAIGFMYAAVYPDEVDFLICLDIASPSVRDVTKTVSITGSYIDKFLNYEKLTLDSVPCYEYDEMIDIMHKAHKGSITKESAEILMRRGMNMSYTKNKYFFSRDPKLKVSILGMLSLDLVLAYASSIKCAYLNIRAVPGMVFDQPENYHKVLDKIKQQAKKFEYHEVEGTHHVHLNEPEKVAPIIKNFIENL